MITHIIMMLRNRPLLGHPGQPGARRGSAGRRSPVQASVARIRPSSDFHGTGDLAGHATHPGRQHRGRLGGATAHDVWLCRPCGHRKQRPAVGERAQRALLPGDDHPEPMGRVGAVARVGQGRQQTRWPAMRPSGRCRRGAQRPCGRGREARTSGLSPAQAMTQAISPIQRQLPTHRIGEGHAPVDACRVLPRVPP